MTRQKLFLGNHEPRDVALPDPPPWRRFVGEVREEPHFGELDEREQRRAATYVPAEAELEMVDAALLLRRPLLLTGNPGTGKSTLAYAVAHELNLGPVLRWPITSRTTVQD